MALGRMERILILAKTYPSPSAQYMETSCVAGISQDGSMRRLFPVPFRMVEHVRLMTPKFDAPWRITLHVKRSATRLINWGLGATP